MPPSKDFPVLVINQDGEIKKAALKKGSAKAELTLEHIQSFYDKKNRDIDIVATYPYKTYTIFLFGSANGDEGTENNHQLPPPYDSNMIYGDMIVVASKEEDSFTHPIDFTTDEYDQFYSKCFGGYGSEGEEEVPVVDVEIPEQEEEDKETEEDEELEEEEEKEPDLECGELDEGDEIKPKIKKKRGKVLPANSILTTINTYAYPNRPILSEDDQLKEDIPCKGVPIRERLLKTLQSNFDTRLRPEQILQLEMCIYNGALKEAFRRNVVRSWDYPLFAHIYKMRTRQIICNFEPASYVKNTELFSNFDKGNISFDAIATMNSYDLYPSKWKESFELQQLREKSQLEGNKSMATDQFLCTRCWKRECTYYEMQTRSADEPMTIFITCVNCHKHWRQ
jgi:DNA-directed RNA polymerase subunit M/transcription elongation factor TFIIS